MEQKKNVADFFVFYGKPIFENAVIREQPLMMWGGGGNSFRKFPPPPPDQIDLGPCMIWAYFSESTVLNDVLLVLIVYLGDTGSFCLGHVCYREGPADISTLQCPGKRHQMSDAKSNKHLRHSDNHI